MGRVETTTKDRAARSNFLQIDFVDLLISDLIRAFKKPRKRVMNGEKPEREN